MLSSFLRSIKTLFENKDDQQTQSNDINKQGLIFGKASGYGKLPKDETELKQSHHHLIDNIVYGGDKSEFHRIIDENSVPKSGDKEYLKGIGRGRNNKYISYFYKILKQYKEIDPQIIFTLDWKEAVSEFRLRIEDTLKGTDYHPILPADSNYPSDASILYGLDLSSDNGISTVFEDYAIALSHSDLQFIILESYGDEFVFFICPLNQYPFTKTGIFFNSIYFYLEQDKTTE